MSGWKDSRSWGRSSYRPLADAAAGRGHDDVQTAELVDRGLQVLLDGRVVGDVDRVEVAVDTGRDLLAVGASRSRIATLAPRSCRSSALARPMPEAPPMTMTFLPLISIQTSLFVRMRSGFALHVIATARDVVSQACKGGAVLLIDVATTSVDVGGSALAAR